MENKEILKELRSIMGLNRREFAEYFCIPYRTVHFTELSGRHSVLERPLSEVNGRLFFS